MNLINFSINWTSTYSKGILDISASVILFLSVSSGSYDGSLLSCFSLYSSISSYLYSIKSVIIFLKILSSVNSETSLEYKSDKLDVKSSNFSLIFSEFLAFSLTILYATKGVESFFFFSFSSSLSSLVKFFLASFSSSYLVFKLSFSSTNSSNLLSKSDTKSPDSSKNLVRVDLLISNLVVNFLPFLTSVDYYLVFSSSSLEFSSLFFEFFFEDFLDFPE